MPDSTPYLHVVAGVIRDHAGRILMARRLPKTHLAGKWEFPGGKLEPGEGRWQGLRRELSEELGIEVASASPLITVPHIYPDKAVYLDVWDVLEFRGQCLGREGQEIAWFQLDQLGDLDLPAADAPVVRALKLPREYLITPDCLPGQEARFLADLELSLARGISLVQFRVKALADPDWLALAEATSHRVHAAGAQLLVNGANAWRPDGDFDGFHLRGAELDACAELARQGATWVAASCHDLQQLNKAQALGVDFAVLSPLAPTGSHPDQTSFLGWSGFAELVRQVGLPVYALGGVGPESLIEARSAGAQGAAGISRFWGAPT